MAIRMGRKVAFPVPNELAIDVLFDACSYVLVHELAIDALFDCERLRACNLVNMFYYRTSYIL